MVHYQIGKSEHRCEHTPIKKNLRFNNNQPGDLYLHGIGSYRQKKEKEEIKNITHMMAEIAYNSSHSNIAEKIRASRNSGTQRPFEDMAQPSADMTRPSADTTQPSADMTQPSADTTQPSADMTQPLVDMTQPSVNMTQPSANMTQASVGMTENPPDFLEKFVLLQDMEVARRLYRGSGIIIKSFSALLMLQLKKSEVFLSMASLSITSVHR
jgi:hypothetical protein